MTKIIANVDKDEDDKEVYRLSDGFPYITATTNESAVYMVTDGVENLIMREGAQWPRSSPRVRKIKINSPMAGGYGYLRQISLQDSTSADFKYNSKIWVNIKGYSSYVL